MFLAARNDSIYAKILKKNIDFEHSFVGMSGIEQILNSNENLAGYFLTNEILSLPQPRCKVTHFYYCLCLAFHDICWDNQCNSILSGSAKFCFKAIPPTPFLDTSQFLDQILSCSIQFSTCVYAKVEVPMRVFFRLFYLLFRLFCHGHQPRHPAFLDLHFKGNPHIYHFSQTNFTNCLKGDTWTIKIKDI